MKGVYMRCGLLAALLAVSACGDDTQGGTAPGDSAVAEDVAIFGGNDTGMADSAEGLTDANSDDVGETPDGNQSDTDSASIDSSP